MNPFAETEIAGKAVAQSVDDVPAGCPVEANPYPNTSSSNLVFFTIVDKNDEVRGYLLGITENRWGHVNDLPDDLKEALENSTKVVGDLDRGPANWYAGMAQGSDHSLGQLISRSDRTGLSEHFQGCRLGGFWRDMHVGYTEDLLEFCQVNGDSKVQEQAYINRKCGLDEDLKRYVLNKPFDYKSIEEPSDRKRYFEALDLSETNSLLADMMAGQKTSMTKWPAFSMVDANRMVTQLREDHPARYRLFIAERNRTWVERMLGYMRGRNVPFFALTVGQLPGPDGIVAMLRNAGFRVVES